MSNLKNRSGITLVSVIFTFIVLSMIAVIAIPNVNRIYSSQQIAGLKEDLELLQDQVNNYYRKTEHLPIYGTVITTVPNTLLANKNQNDNGNYYKIDASLFDGVRIKLTGEVSEGAYYIVNERSLQVYYYKGVVSDGETIHAINTDSTWVSNDYTGITFGFEMQVLGNDIVVTAEDISDIRGYRYKIDNQDWTDLITSNTYTYTNVTYAKHSISVQIEDNNGNRIYSIDNPSEITII